MSTVLIYVMEVLVCAGVFWLLFVLFLDQKVSYPVSRVYLLGSMFLPYIIPALKIPVYPAADLPDLSGLSIVASEGLPVESALVYGQMLWIIGITVSVLLVLRLVYSLYVIRKYRKGARIIRESSFTLIKSDKVKSPFSILNNIYVGMNLSEEELQQIIVHEQSHIRHHHSLELIFCEVISSLGWFNPFVWLLRRHLIAVHEFEADREVMESGYQVDLYQNLILKQLFGYIPEVANGLNQSLTKKRFLMMTQKPVNKHVLFRIAAILPVILALLMLFSFTEKQGDLLQNGIADPPKPNDEFSIRISGGKDKTAVSNDTIEIKLVRINSPDDKILWVLDGKIVGSEVIKDIKPDQIESIEVLKDTNATAIYGDKVKGKEGVILMNTKKGKVLK